MSGPDQVQDVEINRSHEYKERQQSQARIRISNLLCSIEAAEPMKTEPWASPRTETVHLDGLSCAQSSQSPQQNTWHSDREYRNEYGYRKHSDAHRYQSHTYPNPPIQTIPAQSPIQSSPHSSHDTQHGFNSSSSNTTHNDSPVYAHSTSAATHAHDPRHSIEINERRDSGLGRRDIDTRDSGYTRYDRSYSSSNWDPSRSTPREHTSSFSTPSSVSSAPSHFTPRSTPGQRSASIHTDYHHDNHPSYEMEQRQRTDRSKSDFALHQQNYGPYLDTSPSLPPAPLFQTRQPSPTHEQYRQSNPRPQSPPHENPPPAYYYDRPSSPVEHTRSSYQPTHAPRRSIQGDTRRPSQGIVLPPPDSLFNSAESRKPTRIYGLDAADFPARPPLAPSASFGAKPLHDIPDESEVEYSRRASAQHGDQGYRHVREPSSRYNQRPYEYHSTSSPNSGHSGYQSNTVDRPQYDYGPQDNVRAPPTTSSTPYSQNRPEYSRYSPGTDVQPPTWYKQYAHAVPHKPQPRSSLSHGDSHGYSSQNRRESDYASSRNMSQPQRPRTPEHWNSRSSFSAGPPAPNTPVNGDDRDQSATTPSSKPRLSTSHSVHPFDVPSDPPASPPSVTGKRDRGPEEDPFVSEDGVKAKRKRANQEQLSVLNAAFERSYFPSTEERLRLSKQTKMCPRTVQIWFQNKRQSVKARTEAMDAAVAAVGAAVRRRGSQVQSRTREEPEERNPQNRAHDEINDQPGHRSRQYTQDEERIQRFNHHQQQQQQQPEMRRSPLGLTVSHAGEKRRSSGPLTPSDSVMSTLQIRPDDRDVDYFSRKRRATIAQMEQREY
ncbi:hypothetical protein BGX27_010042 [Mortierella sp. AM989]|nr:hypothetical protein BGX27_010042 [Mortierella sp. AM989]